MTAATAVATRIDASIGDADLVALVRSGDDDAFEELYRRHHGHVTAVVARMVRDRTRTEDIVQDVFLSALRRLRETDSEMLFRAWVSEIARNAAIDHFRRAGRTNEVSIDADQPMASVDSMRLAVAPSPELTAIGRERFGHLRGALDELSESHQRVIVLRELEGHSYREIAQLMNLSPSGVESTLFRARRRLEQEYEQLDSGVRCVATQAAIMRIGDGDGSWRDRRKLHRHARRCSMCRRLARENGIEPMLPAGVGAKVAAWLPFPFPALLGRRRTGIADQLRGFVSAGSQQGLALAPASGPAWDQAAPAIGKGLAVLAAVTLIGQGPAARDVKNDASPARASAAKRVALPATAAVRSAPLSTGRAHSANRAPRRHAAPSRWKDAPPSGVTTGAGTSTTRPPAVQQAPRSQPAVPATPKLATPVKPPVSIPDPAGATTRGAGLPAPAKPTLPTNVVTRNIEPVTTVGNQVTGQLNDLVRQLTGR